LYLAKLKHVTIFVSFREWRGRWSIIKKPITKMEFGNAAAK
jgi:hypothetical protein